MSFGSAIAIIQKFATKTGPGAFPNLGISRTLFANDLMDRINSSSLVDQQATSLCGPAVFLFAVLRKDPEVFAKYVIDLYDAGRAKIGGLDVKPGNDCRNYRPVASDVSAVDWVALASLRDGGNAVLDYDSAAVQLGGITLPSSLAGWFRAANFAQVENKTNLFFDSDLQTLVIASARFSSGSTVCLFIGANLLSGREGGASIPDHWVVLTSPIRIDGSSMPSLITMGSKVNEDAKLADAGISFDVFTWGDAGYPVRKRRPQLNVKTCVDFFYGFVAAK